MVNGFGGASLGYDTGAAGGIITLPSFISDFFGSAGNTRARANLSSNIVAVLFAGAFFGSLGAAPIEAWIGKRYGLMVFAFVFIVGSLVTIIQNDALGCIYDVAETAPKHLRGAFGSFFQFFLVIGGSCAYFASYGSKLHISNISSAQWRLPFAMQALPGFILLVGLFFIKESPRWLARKGRTEEALASLAYLRGTDEQDECTLAEFAEIQTQLVEEAETASRFRLKQVLERGTRERFFVAYSASIWLIWSGHNSILYYAPSIFATIGFASNASLMASGLFGIVKMACMPIFMLFFVDRFSRRTLLRAGNLLCCAVLAAFAGVTSSTLVPDSDRSRAAAALLYLFFVFYSFSIGPLGWIVIAEAFDPRTRQLGIASAMALTYLCNFAVARSTPLALVDIGYKWWIILAVFQLLAFATYSVMPETGGQSLEQLDVVFGKVSAAERQRNLNAGDILSDKGAESTEQDEGKERSTRTAVRMV
ncbi:hypothetical protein Rhopal_003081-T1 [Rhodotorula paludigena]|uniref:Major facilitator superfamily (MFS) profile domain-containing protein n=1 Tax=Rhodotorula paludigena TaxID=86838 RepID=A0AAV5GN20_9BASI|nr:hypothetical protein Rhopal_003081-T1 [Rhodotorula paludigena]